MAHDPLEPVNGRWMLASSYATKIACLIAYVASGLYIFAFSTCENVVAQSPIA